MSDNAALVIIVAVVAFAWVADNFFHRNDKDED